MTGCGRRGWSVRIALQHSLSSTCEVALTPGGLFSLLTNVFLFQADSPCHLSLYDPLLGLFPFFFFAVN